MWFWENGWLLVSSWWKGWHGTVKFSWFGPKFCNDKSFLWSFKFYSQLSFSNHSLQLVWKVDRPRQKHLYIVKLNVKHGKECNLYYRFNITIFFYCCRSRIFKIYSLFFLLRSKIHLVISVLSFIQFDLLYFKNNSNWFFQNNDIYLFILRLN